MRKHNISKIISGGQTGADIAGLEVAKMLNIETGGWCIKNFQTEDGPNLNLRNYNLKCLDSEYYPDRTKKNIDCSDATLVFRLKFSLGSDKTIGYAQTKKWQNGQIKTMNKNETLYKPVCVITNLDNEDDVCQKISIFLIENNVKILNVAGHRESSAPINDFTQKVKNILFKTLQ